MKAIIIAAGLGRRLKPYTDTLPKCLLSINGRTILSYTLESLSNLGYQDITIVAGHLADQLQYPGCHSVINKNYMQNNVLHSLMCARHCLDSDVLIIYSDILVNPRIYLQLVRSPGEIAIVVDTDWRGYYEGRSAHPVSEAEKVCVKIGRSGFPQVFDIGKDLSLDDAGCHAIGEFVGLFKMTASAAKMFRTQYEHLDSRLGPTEPFGAAKEWRKSYLTDFLRYLISKGVSIDCTLVQRGWAEFDTAQDYERFPEIERQQEVFNRESFQ